MKIIVKKCITAAVVMIFFMSANQVFAADCDQRPQKTKPEKIRRAPLIAAGAGLAAVYAALGGQGQSIEENFHQLMIPCSVLGSAGGLSAANLMEGAGQRGWITLNSTVGGAALGALFGLVEGERHMNAVLAMICAVGGGLTGFVVIAGYEIRQAFIVSKPNDQMRSNIDETEEAVDCFVPSEPVTLYCSTEIEDKVEAVAKTGDEAKTPDLEQTKIYLCVASPAEAVNEEAAKDIEDEAAKLPAPQNEPCSLLHWKGNPQSLSRLSRNSTHRHFLPRARRHYPHFSQPTALSCLPKHAWRIPRVR